MSMKARFPRGWIAAVAASTALVLAGCSNDMSGMPMGEQSAAPSSPAASASAEFNDADVTFAKMMIPHHEQAVAMSDTLLKKSGVDARVIALGNEIKAAQQPEIATMRGWLADWGQPAAEASDGDMGDMDHGGGGGGGGGDNGMATAEEMKQFEAADAATGQKIYLEMMIKHHQGAIRMAQDEIANGKHPEAIALARTIESTQKGEITRMTGLLGQL